MLELENQLEAITTPPPEPVIPGPEEEDAEEIQLHLRNLSFLDQKKKMLKKFKENLE
jgi:hypothetical protein